MAVQLLEVQNYKVILPKVFQEKVIRYFYKEIKPKVEQVTQSSSLTLKLHQVVLTTLKVLNKSQKFVIGLVTKVHTVHRIGARMLVI